MSSRATSVMAGVVAALSTVTGLAVLRGRPKGSEGNTAPCCWVAAGPLLDQHGPDLGGYVQTLSVELTVFVVASDSAFGTREDAVLDQMALIGAALRSANWASYRLIEAPILEQAANLSASIHGKSEASAYGVLTFRWQIEPTETT